jgi:hypothetical protein
MKEAVADAEDKISQPWATTREPSSNDEGGGRVPGAIRLQGAAGESPCAPQLPFTAKYSNIWEILRDPVVSRPKQRPWFDRVRVRVEGI